MNFNHDVQMRLPGSFRCKDCFAFQRFCSPLGIAKPENQHCDYYPMRFQPSEECLKELAALRDRESQPS